MFIGKKSLERLENEIRQLRERVDVLEIDRVGPDEGAEKTERLYMEGLSNVMNYSLDTIKKAGEKLGG